MTPYLSDPDFDLYVGSALDVLRKLPSESVNCVVTSPPYWNLRDYQTGSWEGGDAECDHAPVKGLQGATGQRADRTFTGSKPQLQSCSRCGAARVDSQLGLEPTYQEYVAALVSVLGEVRRVLTGDGTLWLNLGDSYNAYNGNAGPGGQVGLTQSAQRPSLPTGYGLSAKGLKPKDLVMIPARVAIALCDDGWYLRSDIIWAKPNPMPESVTDRPTTSHEHVFLLAKSQRYFYDAGAIAEPAAWERWGDQTYSPEAEAMYGGRIKARGKNELLGKRTYDGFNERWNEATANGVAKTTRNARNVWEIATQPYAEAHFATFPEELARRAILAGCPEGGVVLDPFSGSGTVAFVARKHGRRSIGIELNPTYAEMAARRLSQQSLFA